MCTSRSGSWMSGRITLYLLDTNIPENVLPQDRDITDSLYGGDIDTRMRQEIVLGIGGMRALKAMGLKPTVFHMNEGHSAFLALEQIRLYMARRAPELRRSAGSRPRQQRIHDPYPRPRRNRPVRPGPDVPLFLRILPSGGHRFSAVDGPGPAQSSTIATSASPWPCWRSIRRPTATP